MTTLQALVSGDRRALGRAITLAESSRDEDRKQIEALLEALPAPAKLAHRVALTGPPGAGKSSLVEALGATALTEGKRVAVLAVDPASSVSGGSLLGDALRMPRLAASERAFIRSSSNSGALGGTAPGTSEAVLLCEAAGFDLVMIETVGIGQAEHAVRDLCDTLLLLAPSGAGDEVQGMKRGVLELADAVLVNKADDGNEAAARAYAGELSGALSLLRRGSPPLVSVVSAHTELGIGELWAWLEARAAKLGSGALAQQRQQQRARAFRATLSRELWRRVERDARVAQLLPTLEAMVSEGSKLPSVAARELFDALLG